MRANDLFGFGQDLVQGHGGGIKDDGVGCWPERGLGAVAVALVAFLQVAEDGGFGGFLLLGRWSFKGSMNEGGVGRVINSGATCR